MEGNPILYQNIEQAYNYLRSSQIDKALSIVDFIIDDLQKNIGKYTKIDLFNISGLFIDSGSDALNEDLVKYGLKILDDNYNSLCNEIDTHSIEYNIGNGYKGLYNISYFEIVNKKSDDASKINPRNIQRLIKAKQHYWKAIKSSNNELTPQYCVNLANCLDGSCRIYESLIWYDKALKLNSNFSMAYLNKGLALDFLRKISGTYTIKLLSETKANFELSIESKELNKSNNKQAEYYKDQYEFNLLSLGYDEEKIKSFDSVHSKEYEEHSEFWKWCLENYLVLSEHSLYCKCVGSRRDDLTMAKQAGSIGGSFVPIQENLLNHIKSEFCLARALYFQAITHTNKWETKEYEGCYSELHIGEKIGIRTEFMKTSFRLCFGILDKIARGVANQFDLAKPEDSLYFDSFWKKNDKIWESINKISNTGLNALYSIATDLINKKEKEGEWGFYKKYRNALEHDLFVITDKIEKETKSLIDTKTIQTVSYDEFTEHALQMLQFTASAIFSFVFCIRLEGDKYNAGYGEKVTLDKKKIGKE